ncbi:hypothetical protein ACHAPE_009964 [Trichoderma viride]
MQSNFSENEETNQRRQALTDPLTDVDTEHGDEGDCDKDLPKLDELTKAQGTWMDHVEEDFQDVEETFMKLAEEDNPVTSQIHKQLIRQYFRERSEWEEAARAEFKEMAPLMDYTISKSTGKMGGDSIQKGETNEQVSNRHWE